MKLNFVIFVVMFVLLFGCENEDKSKASETNSTTGVSTNSKINSSKNLNNDSDNEFRDEGAARPTGIVEKEKKVQRHSFDKPIADQMISIPSGKLLSGSAPQDILRVNYAEGDLIPHDMTAFEIDALPYPNDPSRPFFTGLTKSEADQKCAEIGKRLCTELEWEWACKSIDNRRYPTGNDYDVSAYLESDPIEPASPFGVFAMGRILEWTMSKWGKEADQVERGVARGYADGNEMTAIRGRRCAMRWRRIPDGTNADLGFRCCRGDINKANCFIEPTRPAFSKYNNIKPDKFAEVILSIPELKAIHDGPHMFSDGDVRAVLARRESNRKDLARQGIHFHWKPMRWIPRQGMELWVAVGRAKRHSFIVALHEIEDNEKYMHASSLILWNQPAPLSLVYREGHRDELYWAPCWGCRDGGAVTFNDETNEVIITHKW